MYVTITQLKQHHNLHAVIQLRMNEGWEGGMKHSLTPAWHKACIGGAACPLGLGWNEEPL